MQKVILSRDLKKGTIETTVDGVYINSSEVISAYCKALRLGNAILLVDTDETLAYNIIKSL